jgi:uncharacterized OsmC-like protein
MSQTTVNEPHGSAVVYRSVCHIVPAPGRLKMVTVPLEADAVPMGVHGAIAKHYKLTDGMYTPHAATLDYVVGATGGCLMGTLSGALTARQIATGDGRLTAETIGEIENEEGVLVIKRIIMRVMLRAPESQRATAERVIDVYAPTCPVYRSLCNAIDITTEIQFEAV